MRARNQREEIRDRKGLGKGGDSREGQIVKAYQLSVIGGVEMEMTESQLDNRIRESDRK